MKFVCLLITIFLIHPVAHAAQPDITLKGPMTYVMPEAKPTVTSHQAFTPTLPKTITLLNVELSSHAWHMLSLRTEKYLKNPRLLEASLTEDTEFNPLLDDKTTQKKSRTHAQLGMSNVPVMEQGAHGTCATFAVTAALNAALDAGDYISQLCNLQLGQHLEHDGYNPSGWDGSLGSLVLNQIQAFGLVNKETQRRVGCGGLTEYPTADATPATNITLTDFHNISEPLPEDNVAWSSILDAYQVFLDHTDPKVTLESVKKALRENDRLTFGVLLFGLSEGPAGAVGKYHKTHDTWVLTPQIIDDILQHKNYGGHAMIITGFDDYAVAVDTDGRRHQGLLTLRNSWGEKAGDSGDFYMAYDYFKPLSIEIQRIRSIKPSES